MQNGIGTYSLKVSYKVKHMLTLWPSNHIYPKQIMFTQAPVHKCYSNSFHNYQKLEIAQMSSTGKWFKKKTVVSVCNIIPFSNKKNDHKSIMLNLKNWSPNLHIMWFLLYDIWKRQHYREVYWFFYCFITNAHKLSSLKQCIIISQFLWVRSQSSDQLSLILRSYTHKAEINMSVRLCPMWRLN